MPATSTPSTNVERGRDPDHHREPRRRVPVNCSQYSNVILRLGGARNDLIHTMRTNPFIWQYARKAGFRTIYVDAQAPEDKNTGRLQNYMTVEEVKWIDEFVVIQNTSSPTLDFKALEMVGEKLKGDTPYFIYVNKNG